MRIYSESEPRMRRVRWLLAIGLLAAVGCVEPDEPSDASAERALSAVRFKLRNPTTGLCLRRSTTQVVGAGFEVYQASCTDTAAQLWWRDECAGADCKYVGGDGSDYCIKASSSILASGGSYNIYAAGCSSDLDQRWIVTELGGGQLRLQNRETARCAAASESELTGDGQPQIVQRTCDDSATKQRFVKVPEASSSTRYEAERRSNQYDSVVASNNPGFTGSGFMDYGGAGSWIEWNNVNAPAAGRYTLSLRYANGGASNRPLTVDVNATGVGTLPATPTGAWDTWSVAPLVVSLRQGPNTVRLTASGSAGPNVDHLEVTPEGTATTAVKLPIEVLGPSGTRVSVQFQVDDTSNITHLYVQCNACGYHVTELDSNAGKVKASVRVNGGPPIALKRYSGNGPVVGTANLEVLDAAADYGGIGGVFRTVRLKVPVTGIVTGMNTLTFEHVNAAPPGLGFRIIELNLLRGGSLSNRVLASFVQDDPATWVPPSNSASDIDAGRRLWGARSSLYDPGVDAIDGVPGRGGAVTGNIVASCADCHASDGRDLAYFNFSNSAIIERSIFHGLSRQDGSRIASYIRSLRARVPLVRAARPWNPTYQPGPDLDDRPAYEWAAGAGVGAILARDDAMAGYLFPGGQSLTAVRQVVNRHAKLNLRELPVALPMPEWNQWLPQLHPDDAFNTAAAAIRADEGGDSVGKPYYTALYEAAAANPTPRTIGDMTSRVKAWLKRGMTCDTNGAGNGEPWRGLNGGVLNAIKLPKRTYSACVADGRRRADEEAYEIAKRGLAAWIAVKQWEIVHGNNLEEEGAKTQTATVPYVGGNRTLQSNNVCGAQCVDARERGWFVTGRNAFDRPPHFTGHNSRHYYGQDLVSGVAETNSWYHLNMLINPGYRIAMPNHFAYVCSHIEILQAESGVDQGFRFWASMIKQRQLQTNGLYGVEAGHDLRTSQPHVYYQANRNGTSDTQASVGQPLWRYLAQAMVEDFVADASRATRAQWEAATNNSAVQAWDSQNFSTGTTFDTGALQGRNTFRVIPRLRELGIASSAVTSLIDWGKRTWPNGNWDSLR